MKKVNRMIGLTRRTFHYRPYGPRSISAFVYFINVVVVVEFISTVQHIYMYT